MIFRTALLLGLLLSMSAIGWGAALSNASLRGPYFFVLQKVDTNVSFGFSFTTAQGTLLFDQNGKVAVQGSINRDGTLQTLSGTGTYSLSSTGDLRISVPEVPLSVAGQVSFDLNSLVTSNAASGALSHQVLLATRQAPQQPASPALLNGTYFLSERTISASGSSPQLESGQGIVYAFDGQGNCTVTLSTARAGQPLPLLGQGSYQVLSDGSVLLTLPGRSDPVRFGLTPDAGMGVGTTQLSTGKNTHDIFVITKRSPNSELNGSYYVMLSAFSDTMGFSTVAGQADYTRDGKASYQLAQNGTGIVSTISGQSTYSPIDAAGNLILQGLPNLPEFGGRGGLGSSSHVFVAASAPDISRYNLLVGIRTPSQVASAVNAASFSSTAALSPGALISIFGRNLARQTAQASSLPLPTILGGATVRIGGIDAPLLFVSPYQLNLQVPYDVPLSNTTVTIVLDGVESGPLPVIIGAASPGVFTLSSDGNGAGIFLHGSDFSLVTRTNPAKPGEVILIYVTGLGAVLPGVASGSVAPGDPPASAAASVSVQIGGLDAGTPAFAGLAPGFAGLYQINVSVPSGVTPGDIPLVVTAAGVQGKTVALPVSP
ncbi:MAG: hypothetical protein HYX72_09885 [Acidobacteria bacterium]|nr:hypothetical protein [Acidobacteriota bacterium]